MGKRLELSMELLSTLRSTLKRLMYFQCKIESNYIISESEFNKFEPRLKSAKNRFQLSTGLNLETLNTIFS